MNNPIISIITVCYNAISTIEITILSVLNQKYDNKEYIIIDGGSTDGTVDIIKKYENKINYWVSEPDNGIYDAMNKGINRARGKYINFMNAGDSFYDYDILSKINWNTLNSIVIFGDSILTNGKRNFLSTAKPFYDNLPLHGYMGFIHQSSFVRSDILKKYNFDLSYRIASDYDLIIKIFRNYGKNGFLYLNKIIAKYDINGISTRNTIQLIYETLTIDDYIKSKPKRIIKSYILGIYSILSRPLKWFLIKIGIYKLT